VDDRHRASVSAPSRLRSASARRPRVGFLGLGWIGRHRLEAIGNAAHVEVAAIADPDAAAVEAVRPVFADAASYRSLDDLLVHELDGIVIATPTGLHAQQTLQCLDMGLAVFCQKPLACTGEENASVIEAARQADRLLGIDLSYRHTAGLQIIRKRIALGEIGRVFAAELVFHNAYGPDKQWYYNRAMSGGGCVTDLGVHLVDAALWCLGFPKVEHVRSRLFAEGRELQAGDERVEDFARAELGLSCGTAVALECSWNAHAGRDAVISATFWGSEGSFAWQNVDGSFFDFETHHFKGTQATCIQHGPETWNSAAAVDWSKRLAQSNRFDPEIEPALAVASVLDRIGERSA
jgi:predicted dehydrogenase